MRRELLKGKNMLCYVPYPKTLGCPENRPIMWGFIPVPVDEAHRQLAMPKIGEWGTIDLVPVTNICPWWKSGKIFTIIPTSRDPEPPIEMMVGDDIPPHLSVLKFGEHGVHQGRIWGCMFDPDTCGVPE